MKIDTKFNIGDTVFGMSNNKLFTTEIRGLQVHAKVDEVVTIKYFTNNEGEMLESHLFGTRQEIADTIVDGTYNDRVNGK